MADRLVTITRFSSVHEAEVARAALQSEGIDAVVADANIASIAPHLVRTGVRLQVLEVDSERAELVLNRQYGVEHAEEVEPSAILPAQEPRLCPQCGSPDIHAARKVLAFTFFVALTIGVGIAIDQTMGAFLIVLAGLAIAIVRPRWRCSECGHSW